MNEKEICNACEGTGLLGFQREQCWFCGGEGELNVSINPKLSSSSSTKE